MSSYVKVVKTNVEDLTTGKYYEVNCGKFLDDVGDYRVVNKFHTGTLELIDHKPFTKADLKNGMRCLAIDGVRYMYLDGNFVHASGWNSGDSICDDLSGYRWECSGFSKVYDAPHLSDMLNLSKKGDLLWERPEPAPVKPPVKEMTVADIEEALGHSIKVVK